MEFLAGAQLFKEQREDLSSAQELPNSQMPIVFLQMSSHFLPSNHTVKEHRLPLTMPLAELPGEEAARKPYFTSLKTNTQKVIT